MANLKLGDACPACGAVQVDALPTDLHLSHTFWCEGGGGVQPHTVYNFYTPFGWKVLGQPMDALMRQIEEQMIQDFLGNPNTEMRTL